ncbi:hypothetical protein [Streptomyces sp. NPDC051776]|uniref:hypothetical protein n=1 Tax=Streptomyces sp. NPDC051776 TaxID=3155414 RepID=UPI003429700C
MRVHRIATATMLVLEVGGWTATGFGKAFADTGPAGRKAKASAQGGSSTGGEVFQQNVAQSSRQNNNCNNPNTGDTEGESLTGSRATGRCVTKDNSLTEFSRIHNGPVEAQGGSSITSLAQQNTAQRGRQNNNCNNENDSTITVEGGRVEARCADEDFSFSKHTLVKGGAARAEGGSSTLVAATTVAQQNTAQEGRQNNNCASPNFAATTLDGGQEKSRCGNKDTSFSKHIRIKGGGARAEGGSAEVDVLQQNIAQEGRQNNNCRTRGEGFVGSLSVTGGRVETRCGNRDGSFSKHTGVKGGGARAEGGGAEEDLFQQNIAQEGRQNNNCDNPNNNSSITVAGGRVSTGCGNKDTSFSKHTRIKGGGARAEGGSGGADVSQQNIAQHGRQNNNCASYNHSGINLTGGGRVKSRCGNKDTSLSKHTLTRGGGARAEGGSSGSADFSGDQQNIAQEGRQNNHCANPNLSSTALDDRQKNLCGNKDGSFSKHTRIKGGGARAEGGSSTASYLVQQNTAQDGRQNNVCHNSNMNLGSLEVNGGRVEASCGNKDASFNKQTQVTRGGARAEGGSTTAGTALQQNVAQEGRQNNTCNNPNSDATITTTGDRVGIRCRNKDISFNRKTVVKSGGAAAEGGSSTTETVNQQNVAQEGRQNNNCANPNLPPSVVELSSNRLRESCKTVDGSANVHTTDIGGGAKAEGGSATAALFQQNSAQEGRQNNTCSDPNNLTLNASGSRTQAHCVAVDRSTNLATINR